MICITGKKLIQLDRQTISKGNNLKHLDVSINNLSRGVQFRPFVNLMTLIIDENQFKSLTDFPVFRDLQTFSANKNQFADFGTFLNHASDKIANVRNLSLLKNPMNPFFENQQKYKNFKKCIVLKFPHLFTLDGMVVKGSKEEIDDKTDDQKYQRIIATLTFDQKYAQDAVKSVKNRSQGNRFLKNHHL